MLFLLAAFHRPGLVHAQTLPSTIEPGREETPVAPAPERAIELEWETAVPGGVEVPANLADVPIHIEDVILDGLGIYTREDLLPIFKEQLGQDVSFAELYRIARDIQKRYHEDGYFLSFTYIPPQRVKDNIYTIAIVEGYVDQVSVEGEGDTIKEKIKSRLSGIAGVKPLQSAILERSLLLSNDLKGIKASGVLRPSKDKKGASDLVVKFEHKPVAASIKYDNRGSRYVGRERVELKAEADSVLGLGESLGVQYMATPGDWQELRSFDASYSQPLFDDGLRFDFSSGISRADPGYTLRVRNVLTRSFHADADLSYPLIRSRDDNLEISLGYTHRDTEVKLGGQNYFTDNLRMARAALSYNGSDFLGGSSGARLGLVQFLPFFGSSQPERQTMSRADTNDTATKLTLSLSRFQGLPLGANLLASFSGQYALDSLPSSEEFAAGGARYGRAYDDGELTGDHGMGFSVEIGRPFVVDAFFIDSLTPYGFYDIAKIWDRPSASASGESHSLASTGAGLRADFAYGFSAGMEYTRALTRPTSIGEDDRFFINISASL